MNKKNKIIVSIVGITIVLLALLGITYAYYLTRIEGNTNTNSISITTADLKLVYRENDGIVTAENIMPGTTIEKNFTVTNSGNNKVDNYAVYLEELVNTLSRTEDLTYKLECTSSSGTCKGSEGEFPTLADDIVVNSIDKEVTHTYKLTVTYKNEENIDQSIDMGSKISALVQIYAMKDILDIEGSVTGTEDGDFAQINSVQKRSQIVDGKYKFAGVLPGTHTIKICSKTDTNCDSPKLTKSIVVNLGAEAKVDGNTITMTDDSQTANIDINVTGNSITIDSSIKEMESAPLLANAIINRAKEITESDSKTLGYAIYSETLRTTPGQDASATDESLLLTTDDNYTETTDNPAYYFRGNVKDNYINFAGMCWRIVSILGNNNVKLVLSDRLHECNDEDFGEAGDTGDSVSYYPNEQNAFIQYSSLRWPGDDWFNNDSFPWAQQSVDNYFDFKDNFSESHLINVLNAWLNGGTYGYYSVFENFTWTTKTVEKSIIDQTLLFEEKWCNDTSIDSYGEYISYCDEDVNCDPNKTYQSYEYSGYNRVKDGSPSLKCSNEKTLKIGMLTADEIMFAGQKKGSTNNTYLSENASGDTYWTMTPAFVDYNDGNSNFLHIVINNLSTQAHDMDWDYSGANIRPAIVLKNKAVVTKGNGTQSNPYVVE